MKTRGDLITVLKRTGKEFQDDELTDKAAALTYYGVLSLFPALIFLTSILGLVGKSATQPLINNLTRLAPTSAGAIVNGALKGIQNNRTTPAAPSSLGLQL